MMVSAFPAHVEEGGDDAQAQSHFRVARDERVADDSAA